MQEETKQQETAQGKRHYIKPSLTAVQLFADQVLGCVGNLTVKMQCAYDDPVFS